MRMRAAIFVRAIWLSSAILFTPLLLSVAGLSGRASQRAGPASLNVRTAAPPGGPQGETAAPVGSEYRLIFPTSCFGTAGLVESEDNKVRASKFDSFVEQLSRAGAEGYRLTSFAYAHSGLPVAVVRRGAARYEYTWLAYRDKYNWLEGAGGFKRQYAALSQRGFRL